MSQSFAMGRIVASATVHNPFDKSKSLRCDASVDTGTSHLVLPSAGRDRLGDMPLVDTVKVGNRDSSLGARRSAGTGDYSDRGFPGHCQRGSIHRYGTGRWDL